MRTIRSKLTFANVTAVIALFVALGGGAYAVTSKAPKDSVNSKAIVDGSVKSKDVKDNSLTGADINQSTLAGNGGGGGGGVPSGPAGGDLTGNYPKPQIAPGTVGQNTLAAGSITFSKLGTIVTVSKDVPVQGQITEVIAECPAGSYAIRGGGDVFSGTAPLEGTFPYANGARSGWTAVSGAGSGELFAQADCLQ